MEGLLPAARLFWLASFHIGDKPVKVCLSVSVLIAWENSR